MNTAVAPETLTAKTLKTELMAITLDELKNAQDVWQKLGEQEQDDILNRLDRRVTDAAGVARAARLGGRN